MYGSSASGGDRESYSTVGRGHRGLAYSQPSRACSVGLSRASVFGETLVGYWVGYSKPSNAASLSQCHCASQSGQLLRGHLWLVVTATWVC